MNEFHMEFETFTLGDRMCRAYDTIELMATNGFSADDPYKRAHQALHAAIKQLEDENYGVEKFVDDVIPRSNLAKYGHYSYNEARERMYKSSAPAPPPWSSKPGAISFEEPWMHPAVEPEIERFDAMEEYPAGNLSDVFPFLFMAPTQSPVDTPSMESMFECLPLCSDVPFAPTSDSAFTTLTTGDLPYYFRLDNDSNDGVLLRSHILSDYVRNLWKAPAISDKERFIEVYRSLLENYFFHDDDNCLPSMKNVCVARDENLQELVNSIASLNNKIPKNVEEFPRIAQASNSSVESEVPPTRRLYSDVVQGNKSQKSPEAWIAGHKHDTSADNSGPGLKSSDSTSNTSGPLDDDLINEDSLVVEGSSTSSASGSSKSIGERFSPLKSYSDAVSQSGHCSSDQTYDFFTSPTTGFDAQTNPPPGMRYPPSHNYLPYMYNNYRMPYNRNQTMVRTPPPGFPSRPPVWHPPTFRPPPYNMVLPQLPSKHRWPYSHFVRPPMVPGAVFPPLPGNAGPQIWPPPSSPPNMNKKKAWKCPRSRTPDGTSVSSNKTHIVKKWTPLPLGPIRSSTVSIQTVDSVNTPASTVTCPNKAAVLTTPAYQLQLQRDLEEEGGSTSGTSVVVCASDSEELERIALLEYQSSNDLFFKEIERQAAEQYDGNPENSCRPPSSIDCSKILIGGLQITIGFIFHLYLCVNSL